MFPDKLRGCLSCEMVGGVGRIEDLKKVKKKKIGADTLRKPTKNKHENNPGVASFSHL